MYGCNIMRPAICRYAMSAFTHLQSLAAGECDRPGWRRVGWEGRDVTSTGVCITHSVEKSLHSVGGLLQLQAYNTGQTTSAIRLHSRTLLVSEGKAVVQLSMAWQKTLILFTRGTDRDQIVAWRHDHRSLQWSHEHSLTNQQLVPSSVHTHGKDKQK